MSGYYEHSLTLLLYMYLFMLSFVSFVMVCSIFEWKQICLFLFVVIVVRDLLMKRGLDI